VTAVVCTGIAASWCPIHGDCTCPRDEGGVIEWHFEAGYVSFHGFAAWDETAKTVTHYDEACPIHALTSDHADAELDYAEMLA
jgi:hypothetical protein